MKLIKFSTKSHRKYAANIVYNSSVYLVSLIFLLAFFATFKIECSESSINSKIRFELRKEFLKKERFSKISTSSKLSETKNIFKNLKSFADENNINNNNNNIYEQNIQISTNIEKANKTLETAFADTSDRPIEDSKVRLFNFENGINLTYNIGGTNQNIFKNYNFKHKNNSIINFNLNNKKKFRYEKNMENNNTKNYYSSNKQIEKKPLLYNYTDIYPQIFENLEFMVKKEAFKIKSTPDARLSKQKYFPNLIIFYL